MHIIDTTLEAMTRLPYVDYFKKKAPDLIKHQIRTPMLMSLDISNFKYFNQVYGYEAGDRLVERCVYRFCHANSQCVLASRIYVDHVIILLDVGTMDMDTLKMDYNDQLSMFAEEVNREYPLARIRVYVGVYEISDRDEEINSMIDKAQAARRSIKQNYSVNVAFYVNEIANRQNHSAGIIPAVMSALEDNRVMVYIQPKFSIEEQKLIGGEALSRVLDVNGNIIPPVEYIDVLEQSGLIARLDNYVISKVISLQKEWMEKGHDMTIISMNLSRMDFLERGFIQKIDRKIEESGVPKKYFEFEITETIFCENFNEVIKQVEFLRNHGYKISMDDFGSGYNSLYMLARVPVDIIKFDRGFVLNSLGVESGRKIMSSLMNTFKDIKFEVICEGIENREEERIVHECGCNAVQGYLHDKPLPHSVFEDKYLKKKD